MDAEARSSAAALSDRLGRLTTAGLADQFDKLGRVPTMLARELKPVGPAVKFAGPAFCVMGRRHKTKGWKAVPGPRDSLYDSLDEQVPPGSVLVFDTGAYDDTAVFGGGTGLALKQRGCAGAVIDGAVRDVEELAAMGLPTLARAVSAVRFVGRFAVRAIGDPVEVRGLAGPVAVAPGDLILADHDGVIAIPAALAGKLISAAEEAQRIDEQVKADVLRGVPRLEAARRHGKG